MGRVKSPFPRGDRHAIVLSDGATVTFDIFEPVMTDASKGRCQGSGEAFNPRAENLGGNMLLIDETIYSTILIATISVIPNHFEICCIQVHNTILVVLYITTSSFVPYHL